MNTRQFLDHLAGANLFSIEDLAKMRRQLTPEQLEKPPDGFARELIRLRKLTRFQAMQVARGDGRFLTFGEYLILDKLGEGGMGQVYKAEHRRMKRVVALKVLPGHATNSQAMVDRFYKEVELAARLSHPNIVTAYDAGESRGLHYLVMEYVEGHTLSDHIKANGPLSVEQAMNCVLQAARGLEYAHSEGIIHRDIKPSNLMVSHKGVVKILDLGLARVEHSLAVPLPAGGNELTTSGQVLGTVDYMAPEQSYDSRSADHRSDIYSLGCTLYRLLTGHPPYEGETMMQKLLAHREHAIPSLREERGDVPPALDLFYRRMVAKLPDERPRSMREVIYTLESFLTGTTEAESTVTHVEVTATDDEGLDSFLQRMAGSSGIGSRVSSFSETPVPGASGTIRTEAGSGSISHRRNKPSGPAGWLLAAAGSAIVMVGFGAWLAKRPAASPEVASAESKSAGKKKPAKEKANTDNSAEGWGSKGPPKMASLVETPAVEGAAKVEQPPPKAEAAAPTVVEPMPTPASPSPGPAATETANLLEKIDKDASTGVYTVDGNGLAAPNGATLRFALTAPDEYDLTATIDNAKLDGVCRLGLRVQDQATTFELQRNNKSVWWLETTSEWDSARALTIPDGPLTILCAVRKNRVYIAFDGRTAAEWTAGPGTPSLRSALTGSDPRLCLFLQANFRLSELRLAPPTAKLPHYRPVDLLSVIDAARDRASGAVRVEHGDVVLDTTSEQAGSCLSAFAERPTEYVLTALIERTAGQDAFDLGFPASISRVGAWVDIADGSSQLAGLATFSTRPNVLLLSPWRLHKMVCTVRGNSVLRVEIDGQKVFEYQQRLNSDQLYSPPGVRDPGAFFVQSALTSAFRIRRWEISPYESPKLPPPDTDALAAAAEAIQPIITAARSQSPKGDDRSPATRKLWQEASRADDAAQHWALLDAAIGQAASDGDLGLACHIAADLERTFDGDVQSCFSRAFPAAFRSAKSTTARQAVAVEALRQIEAAVALEQFALAESLQTTAAALKSLPNDIQHELKARGIETEFLRDETTAGKKALATLATEPSSQDAHLAAGRYLAVVLADWPAAAEHFKQAGNDELTDLAGKEAQATGDSELSAADLAAVGDRWWSLSTKAATPLKWWYMERAAGWYRRALPASTSKTKTAIESKMKNILRQRKTSGDAFRLRRPLDAVQFNGRWYKYYPAPMTWKRAEYVCRSVGGYLPVIKTPADNLAVVQAIAGGDVPSERRTCWLGCSDEVKEGTWRWIDGTSVGAPGFLNWLDGQPDNANGTDDYGAITVVFEKGELKNHWTDDPNTQLWPFVCVWDD